MTSPVDQPPRSPAAVATALGEFAALGGIGVNVRGVCMLPRLHPGDRLWVVRRRCYLPGDLLAFRAFDGELLIHRLLGYRLRAWRLELVTAADAARRNDVPVPTSAVIGRVVACDPPRHLLPLVSLRDRATALARFLMFALRRLRARLA